MIIGVPREIKTKEYRVGMTPGGVGDLVKDGHRVLVEKGAGEGSGYEDDEYGGAGAEVVARDGVWNRAEMIVKVKEPRPSEYNLLREGQAIFTFLHLAANRELAEVLLDKKVTGLAYGTLEVDGKLPLLEPMSEIAGRMAPLMGAYFLQKANGGRGVLPTGATGAKPARAVILGAGIVGTNAARVSHGIGMETVVLNRGVERLREIDEIFNGKVRTVVMNPVSIEEEIRDAHVVVGAVLVPGGRTPMLITRPMLGTMKKGAVIVDVSVDQGGCVETTRPTTHDHPVYDVGGIIHYGVANMPGAYPRTSTMALTSATLPYIKRIANMGIERAVEGDPIRSALNTYNGEIVHKALMESLSLG